MRYRYIRNNAGKIKSLALLMLKQTIAFFTAKIIE